MTASKVILDMDGVLIDSKASLVAAYLRTCLELDIPEESKEFEVSLGGTLEEIFGKLHPLQSADSLARHFRSLSGDFPVMEFSGAKDFVDYLVDVGVPVDIVTNKDFERATNIADELGFAVDRIWSPSQGFRAKPHPEMLLCSIGNLSASEVLFVGDTQADLIASEAAGCSFVHASWGYENTLNIPSSSMQVDSFERLKEIAL
jgi:phosphoglycolate phosphatase